jgi:plastocyanin
MKRFAILFGLIALLSIPALVLAQDNYPSGGGSMGGGSTGGGAMGGSVGGGIQVGGGGNGGGGNGGSDVTIVDFAYQPSPIIVSPGETVTWNNAGGTMHTVDSNAEAFESPILNPGSDYSVTFDTAGVYPYHCDIHPNMHGMVVVSGT